MMAKITKAQANAQSREWWQCGVNLCWVYEGQGRDSRVGIFETKEFAAQAVEAVNAVPALRAEVERLKEQVLTSRCV